MPIFILVRQLVLLVCINSALIMSPPARTINKIPLNNLYGWAMYQPLPTGGFRRPVNDLDSWTADKLNELVKHGRKRYLLDVDVDYPHHLYDLHSDLPFLPEIIDGKITPNLNDKRNYVVHIRALDQALSHGLVLRKVH